MSQSEVIFYKEGEAVPIRDWLKKQTAKVQIKCLAYIAQLETKGHKLRRPAADFLRDGIYELRPSYQGVNYRILYFFAGKNIVVVSQGLKKESEVPVAEIGRAMERKANLSATRLRIRTSLGSRRSEPIMPAKRKFNSAAVQELYDEVVGSDPSARDEFEQELVNIEVAQLIHDMRTGAGLSQRALAKKVGTSASAINRLESDDYQGHTIAMVRRIATALNRRLELRAVPVKRKSVRTT